MKARILPAITIIHNINQLIISMMIQLINIYRL